MKSFPNSLHAVLKSRISFSATVLTLGTLTVSLAGWQAHAALPRWMQDVISASAIEAALYRAMDLPGAKALYPRPPREAQTELNALVGKAPQDAELYYLRAKEDEQALDFKAAEKDWKAYGSHSSDKIAAKLELADYYHRRLQSQGEKQALMEVASSPVDARETYTTAVDQRSWKAFERLLQLIGDQALSDEDTHKVYTAWVTRYPQQGSVYAREFQWLLAVKKFDDAEKLLEDYRRAFPKDAIFPVKASALLEYRRGGNGSVEKALAVYESAFEPLWPAELIESYYALLAETHQQRRFLSDARARLAEHPDDLKAMARLFYYSQQQGNLAAALQVVEAYRLSKESRKATWSAQELYTLAQLTEAVHSYPDAARYNFALYHSQGDVADGVSAQAEGLSGMVRVLLTAPEEPVELGARNLSMYRDIATLDQGPGYWNGILSLWLNSASPEEAYHGEEAKAQPYFHRAKAAELLALLDKKYPNATARPELHKELIGALAEYGESTAVIQQGEAFLMSFNSQSDETNRVAVAMLMADAYAWQQDTKSEFALYDRLLTELSAKTGGMPLTAATASNRGTVISTVRDSQTTAVESDGTNNDALHGMGKKTDKSRAFEFSDTQPSGVSIAGSQEYQVLLERYLGRLTATSQLPQALAVLRKELDRNPNDPLLYQRLATFLQQNNLSAQQEEVYQEAIKKFQDAGWYDKLARLYLREKKREAFADLTKQVTNIFHGTELEEYFGRVRGSGAQMFLQLNLYAHQRFPHDEVFVQNLLQAYTTKATRNQPAWEALLREHWWDSDALRMQFYDYLNRTGKLDAEMSRLKELVPDEKGEIANPAASYELAEADLWRSHFEESAPLLGVLADAYPADAEIGTRASDVYRSQAYFDSAKTDRAVAIEKDLLEADPSDTGRMERIGDIYSDSGADGVQGHENISSAAPYWRRIPAVHPGTSDGYLEAATVFWDYFQFDDALGEIREARKRFGKTSLYGYEAGAIYEGKRDFASAIREYTAAAIDGNDDASYRLIQLARRKSQQQAVDEETERAAAASNSLTSLELRARVLQIEKRDSEIRPLLEAALSQATVFDQMQAIGTLAQAHTLATIYEHALEREIALASDPVQKIQLSYELERSYEGHKSKEQAAELIKSVYRDNPRIIGVIRTTVDYYWRNKQPAKAIATLTDAAKAAQQPLSREFVVEAAGKANESGNYAQARELMAPLLDPTSGGDAYDAQYLGVVADSYARGGDDAGLREFYLSKLTAIRSAASAKMTADERKQRTVLLRRGLIPALTRMKDYAGAVDQYIAILSAYPEDQGAVDEASLYALRYDRESQLVDFVTRTVKTSPHDSRFAVMLAAIDTTFEHYPEAIDAYAHAVAIRADRVDWYEAKADLEERLQRLDDACADYERIYLLSYQNADWMVKIAAVRARQGHKDEAIKDLQRAWIDGHPPMASSYFRVATQLENWNMLEDGLRFAELGVKTEGDDLLAGAIPGSTSGDDAEGAVIYARLMTKLRREDKALTVLDAARSAAEVSPNSPSVFIAQAEKQGLASVTDDEWRKRRVEMRKSTATQRYQSAVIEIGKTVGAYFTPEEKQGFAKLVNARWSGGEHAGWNERSRWIDVASVAGLRDVEAQLRKDSLLDRGYEQGGPSDSQLGPFIDLQRSRMEFGDLAKTMEVYALLVRPNLRTPAYAAAADAYRDIGDEASELRVLGELRISEGGDDALRARYLQLLMKRDVRGFETFATSSKDDAMALSAPNYAVDSGDVKIARAAIDARAKRYDPVWEKAYSALVGLYFGDRSEQTENAFEGAVGDATIGDRLKTHADPSQQLTGNDWFYYGMRYGVYRTLAPENDWGHADPEDFLAADLERNPAAASRYVVLATAYTDAGKIDAALGEYRHALELSADSAAVHDSMAVLLWKSSRRDEAITHWRDALNALERIQDSGPAPEHFWSDFALIAKHIGSRGLTQQLHGEIDTLLRTYITRNGNYRSEELLEAAFKASVSTAAGEEWVLSLSAAAHDQSSILSDLERASWLPKGTHETVLLREIELARIATSHGDDSNTYALERLGSLQKSLVLFYVSEKQDTKAQSLIDTLDKDQQKDGAMIEAQLDLLARGHDGTKAIAQYLTALEDPGTNQSLRNAAAKLASEGDHADALLLLDFVFDQGQRNHDLMASDYLSLAEARIDSGNIPGALDLLRRLALLSGNVFANTNMAAALLEKKGRDTEAIEFLAVLAKGVPWDASFAVRLAKAEQTTGKDAAGTEETLLTVAGNSANSYELREQAAAALKTSPRQGVILNSAELNLLAGAAAKTITPQQADQPYFTIARSVAAESGKDALQQAALLRQLIAVAPENSGTTDLRMKILRAESDAGHYPTALYVLKSLGTSYVQGETEEGEAPGAGHSFADDAVAAGKDTEVALEGAAPLPSSAALTEAEKLDLALLIADIYQHTDDDASALPYLKLAVYLEKDSAVRIGLVKQVTAIKMTQLLKARNSERSPVIQKAVEQSVVVRPRLTAAAIEREVNP